MVCVNKKWYNNKMNEKNFEIKTIEDKQLDYSQMECVNSKEKHILAVAGAGCGKTTTLLARVKYLLDIQKVNKENLLILSFTNSSVKELKTRIKSVTNEDIDVFTFHKLGKDIITSSSKENISLYKDSLYKFVDEYINNQIKEKEYYEFYDFLINEYKNYVSFDNFGTREEELKYLKRKNIISLDSKYKFTFEDNIIANYLYLHNIPYEYLTSSPFDKNEYASLFSGFYLLNEDKYIFNVLVNENNECTKFGYRRNKDIAKIQFNGYIKYLKEKFKDKIIFTYSYDISKGQFTNNLKQQLLLSNINIQDIKKDIKEIVNRLYSFDIVFVKKLIANFIILMKTTAKTSHDIVSIDNFKNEAERIRSKSFFKIVIPIFNAYEDMLLKTNQIDFNDMILKAKKYVLERKFKGRYTHILIDEFQDISNSRMELVNAISSVNDSSLFCVGDDYQSIFRFTGSDISIFYDYEKDYMAKKYLIEKNFRFDKRIANISNEFILKNPYQIKKELKSEKIEINSFKFLYALRKEELVKVLIKELLSLPKNSEILLLGRYKSDISKYREDDAFKFLMKDKRVAKLVLKERQDLDIEFLTVHKAKGLERDYVFILNTFDDLLGFPCNITDDSLIKMLLKSKEDYPYSEERRLFYVALTRAKKRVYLMVSRNSISPFVEEINKKKSFNQI